MARPKGALNKRTRAALSAAAEGKLGKRADKTLEDLLDIFNDAAKDPSERMRAADIALQYLKPKLAAIEQTTIEPRDQQDPDQLMEKLVTTFAEKPAFLERIVVAVLAKSPELRALLLRLLEQLAPPAPASGSMLQVVK